LYIIFERTQSGEKPNKPRKALEEIRLPLNDWNFSCPDWNNTV